MLCAPRPAGVKVNPRGFGKQTMRKFGGAGGGGGAAGAVGGGIMQAIGMKAKGGEADTAASACTPQRHVVVLCHQLRLTRRQQWRVN
jgi:hypothetical protein